MNEEMRAYFWKRLRGAIRLYEKLVDAVEISSVASMGSSDASEVTLSASVGFGAAASNIDHGCSHAHSSEENADDQICPSYQAMADACTNTCLHTDNHHQSGARHCQSTSIEWNVFLVCAYEVYGTSHKTGDIDAEGWSPTSKSMTNSTEKKTTKHLIGSTKDDICQSQLRLHGSLIMLVISKYLEACTLGQRV